MGLSLFFGSFLSCGKKGDGELQISVKPDTSFILPGNNDTGCYEDEIAGPRLLYPRFQITWNGEGDFYPALIKLTFKASQLGGEFECTVEERISFLFLDKAGVEPVQGRFVKEGSPYNLRSNCAIECPGVRVAIDSGFKVSGQVKLIGYSVNGEEQKPHTARATVFIQNLQ